MNQQPLRCEIETKRDLLVLHLTRQPAGRIADHLAEVRRFEPRLAPLHEVSQMVHDLARPQCFGSRALEQRQHPARLALARPDVGRTRLHVVGDRGERLVELVRQPGRQSLDGGDPEHVRQLGLAPPHLFLRPLALRDVADRSDEPATRTVVELAEVQVQREGRAVLVPAADLLRDADGLRSAVSRKPATEPLVLVPVGWRHQHPDVLTDHLSASVAEDPLGGRVEREDGAAFVRRDDAVHGGLDAGPRHGLALAQRVLGTLALGDVLHGQKDQVRPVAAARQDARVQQHDPSPDLREVVLDLEVGQAAPVGQNHAEQRSEPRNVQLAIVQLVEGTADGRLRREPEGLIEGPVCRQHAQVGVEHQQRFAHRVHDGLGVEPCLLERLCGDVREGDHHALDPVVARAIGQHLPHVPPAVLPLHLLADRAQASEHDLAVLREVGVDATR